MRGWRIFSDHRSFMTLVLLVAVAGGAWMLASRLPDEPSASEAKTGAQVNFLAPDFTLPGLDGQGVSLASLRGSVVLVNLWASWCAPCRSEMPAINRIYRSQRQAGFTVLAVNATFQDDEVSARSFAAGLGLTFPILFDRDGSVGAAYRLHSLPTSYFIGRDRIIREVVVGAMSEAMLEARVKRLLAGGR